MDTRLSSETGETGEFMVIPARDEPGQDSPGGGKRKSWPGVLTSVLVVALLAVVLLGISAPIYYEAKNQSANIYEQTYFIDNLCRDNYTLYWKMAQRVDGSLLSPVELFYPDDLAESAKGEEIDDSNVFRTNPEYLQEYNNSLQSTLSHWYDVFQENWDGYNYLAWDVNTGQSFGNSSDALDGFVPSVLDGEADAEWVQDLYDYYIVMQYDEEGHLTVPALGGAPDRSLDILQESDFDVGEEMINQTGYGEAPSRVAGPRNAIFAYAVPKNFTGDNTTFRDQYSYVLGTFSDMGYGFFYFLFLCAALLIGYLIVRSKRLGISSAAVAVIPFELLVVIFIVATALWSTVARMMVRTYGGFFLQTNLDAEAEILLSLVICFVVCFAILGAVFSVGVALREMRTLGAKEYFNRHSLIAGNAARLRSFFSRLYEWFTRIDLTKKSNRAILRFVIINYIILVLISLTWWGAIFILILYSFILFMILRKRTNKIKAQYNVLLDATKEMAKGRLDVPIHGNLGVFDPVKNELAKIQASFGQAVEAETKSQNMKTELITNVSHDLKTPLTAIITYVDLLKKEDLTEEERRSYVATLDTKSQRLKRLIDDLFEMSKASSRDITLNVTQVDLPALIRQVEAEAQDELGAAGVEFRFQFPEERLVLPLDGDKTSRIFENLILNVAKYAMKGTRAYVSIQLAYGYAYVEMKNVSQTELMFKGDITERFVRGDLSRTTEGSGLGLAIAKSFTEAQGGSFAIATDGDIFKALVVFPLPEGIKAPPDSLPQPG